MGRRRFGIGLVALLATLILTACPAPRSVDFPSRTRYRVTPGDTLSGIAARYHVSVEDLIRLNRLQDPNRLAVGQELILPAASSRQTTTTNLAPGVMLWPVRAPLSSPFGPRWGKPHDGLDFAVPDGTEVHAAAAGVVAYVGNQISGYGNLVVIRHDDHFVTVYAHNSRLLVTEGMHVDRGQVISISGHSGRSTAPHLHFEVRRDGVPCDPLTYLPH